MHENRAELLVDGHLILPALLRDLAAARRTIHIAMFLFFRDPIGEEIARLLARKRAEGVRVRVLINIRKTSMGDPFSTGEKEMMRHDPGMRHDPTELEPLCDWMRERGIELIDSNIDYHVQAHLSDPRLRSIGAQIRATIAIDELHVDHRKIVVIDGRVAYCGGANIGAQYLFHHPFDPLVDARHEAAERVRQGLDEPWWKWHDSLTRFEGPVAQVIDSHFRDRFLLDGGMPFEPQQPVPPDVREAQEVPAPPEVPEAQEVPGRAPRGLPIERAEVLVNEPNDAPNAVRERYLELIRGARESVFIENPYFYHPAIAEALIAAKRARPSLRVDLILPAREWNDNSFAHDAQQSWYARYLQAGIAVHELQFHFTHLKIAVFDGRHSIHGSTNLNFRSLENDQDFELVVCVTDEALAQDVLSRVRDVDLQRSKRFTDEDLKTWNGRFRVRLRDPRTVFLMARRML